MKILIIVGSIRPTRQTIKMAKWVFNCAKKRDLDVELLDLQDYPIPMFDEPASPKTNPDRKPSGIVKKWLDKLASADAYIIVTPEYNHAIPGVLKNAIDYVGLEINRKPVAIASHGSTGGGYASAELKNIISEMHAVPMPVNVAWTHRVGDTFDDDGNLLGEYKEHGPQEKLEHVINELVWYADALTEARAKS